jgi:hypothetical protein
VNLSPADAQTIIKALRSYPSAERAIRYTPVAPTEEQRRIVWESGLADIGDARLVWVNEGDFWSFDRQPQEMLAPSKPVQSHEQPIDIEERIRWHKSEARRLTLESIRGGQPSDIGEQV